MAGDDAYGVCDHGGQHWRRPNICQSTSHQSDSRCIIKGIGMGMGMRMGMG